MEEQDFKFALLSAKIGVFFAKVDNNYDEKEKEFIKQYINKLNQDFTETQIKELQEINNLNLSIDDIIKETEDFLEIYSEENHKPLLHTLMHLIDMVILIDDVIDPSEEEAFNKWKNHFDVK